MSAPQRQPEPIFNLPPAIIGMLGFLVAIHAGRIFLLSPDVDDRLILTFAFIPIRYDLIGSGLLLPGGDLAAWYTPVTYGLLHANWTHLIFNGFWLAAFGSILARRFGTVRFIAFSVAGTLFAALGYYLADRHGQSPVIGASGAISAHVGAAARFMFQRSARLEEGPPVKALSLAGIFSNRSAFAFVAFWLGSNLLFGTVVPIGAGSDMSIAWQAHLGGFLFGLLAFALFDPKQPGAH